MQSNTHGDLETNSEKPKQTLEFYLTLRPWPILEKDVLNIEGLNKIKVAFTCNSSKLIELQNEGFTDIKINGYSIQNLLYTCPSPREGEDFHIYTCHILCKGHPNIITNG